MGVGQPCDIATLEGCTEPLQCRPIVAGSFDGVLCAVICTHSVDDLDCPGIETVCGENGYCVTDDEPACPDFEGSG